MRSIRVEDASGAQFEIHEYHSKRVVLGFWRDVAQFKLDTGEFAEVVDANTFEVVGTGERLVRCP